MEAKKYPNFNAAKKAPELKELGDEVDRLYKLIDNLGYEEMTKAEYDQMQVEMHEEGQKQKAAAIKK